jgi:hypothetical protein
MQRIKVANAYSTDFLEIERPQPLSDNILEKTIIDVLNGKLDKDISDNVYHNFKAKMQAWIINSKLNKLQGFNSFTRIDIINGCTQFIDNLYMSGSVQTIRGDYRYHERLGYSFIRDVGSLIPEIPLVIAMPFPKIGAKHEYMDELLYEAESKNIPVHIDGAWISCCKDINFDFTHCAIKSLGISLSKGLGLGWNRVGLRWTKETKNDSITIMNDFHMNNRALSMIGLHFIENFKSDYLWLTHGDKYYKICNDFGLTPTKSIYLALRNNEPVGVSPLIRYLEQNELS